jgi:exodeoxyribonuclease III
MRIATWNVNSVNARLENLLRWLREEQPDVACLQELKCVDEKFPREPVEELGYNILVHGQKTYNGVAILSKYPMEEARRGLPGGEEDTHSRYIEAVIEAPRPVRVASIYLPNGNPIGTEKFTYKLAWMARLHAHAKELLGLEEATVLAGDYNVIPTELDCENPKNWLDDALFQPESRAAQRALVNLGYLDAHKAIGANPHAYTFWDYFRDAFERDNGIRIDHQLLSPQAADRLVASEVQRHVRGWEKPSDHTPLTVTLAD